VAGAGSVGAWAGPAPGWGSWAASALSSAAAGAAGAGCWAVGSAGPSVASPGSGADSSLAAVAGEVPAGEACGAGVWLGTCVAADGGPDVSVTATFSIAAAVGSSCAGRGVCCSLNGHSFDGDGKGRLLGALDGARRADLLENVQPFGHMTEDAVTAGTVRRKW